MTTPSKRRGTAFEVAVVRCFDSHQVAAFRNAPSGAKDCGDITIPDWAAIVECKATKSIALAEAVDQARIEALHAGCAYGIAVIKRRLAHVGDSYAVMNLDDFIRFANRP